MAVKRFSDQYSCNPYELFCAISCSPTQYSRGVARSRVSLDSSVAADVCTLNLVHVQVFRAFRSFRTENNENRVIARKAISYQMDNPENKPEIENKSDGAAPATVADVATKRNSQTSDTNGVTPRAEKPAPDALTKEATYPSYLNEALDHAELLLNYAAETGTEIEPAIRNPILQSRTASSNGWNEGTAAALLTALTGLAARVKPVTVKSLECSKKETNRVLWSYYTTAALLALVIGTFSVATFVASALSSAIRNDIATGNELAVNLRVQLGPPPDGASSAPASSTPSPSPSGTPPGINAIDVITELQHFASTIRAIDARARQLNLLICLLPNQIPDIFADIRRDLPKLHETFELPDGLPKLAQAASDRTRVYQEVRYFAQNILDEVSFLYGAITACILPVLYALLGACAYLLRSLKLHIRNQTYIPYYANAARFIIAAIGGAVVGLFNNFSVTQGATISPLAIAFLVGYAVDVFYTFLDGMLQTFIKNTPAPPLPPPAGKNPS
jgi:hypothetical protein